MPRGVYKRKIAKGKNAHATPEVKPPAPVTVKPEVMGLGRELLAVDADVADVVRAVAKVSGKDNSDVLRAAFGLRKPPMRAEGIPAPVKRTGTKG